MTPTTSFEISKSPGLSFHANKKAAGGTNPPAAHFSIHNTEQTTTERQTVMTAANVVEPADRVKVVEWLNPSRATANGYSDFRKPDPANDNENGWYVINPLDPSLSAGTIPQHYNVREVHHITILAKPALLTELLPDGVPPPNFVSILNDDAAFGVWRLREPAPSDDFGKFIADKIPDAQLVAPHLPIRMGYLVNFRDDVVFELPPAAKAEPIGRFQTLQVALDYLVDQFPNVKPEVWQAIAADPDDAKKLFPLGPKHTDDSRSGFGFFVMIALKAAGLSNDAIYTIFAKEPIGEFIREGGQFEKDFRRQFVKAASRAVLEASTMLRETKPKVSGEWTVAPIPDPMAARPIIVDGLLQRGCLTMIAGRGGDFKSYFALQMSVSAAIGRDFLGYVPRSPLKVLYANGEDDRAEVQRRLWGIAVTMELDPSLEDLRDRLHVFPGDSLALITKDEKERTISTTKLYDEIKSRIEAEGYDMVVIDPLVMVGAGLDENSNTDMTEMMVLLRNLARETKTAILLVHHFRKAGVGGDADSARGASAISTATRLTLTFERQTETGTQFPGVAARDVIRIDGGKVNYQARGSDRFFTFEAHTMSNGDTTLGLKALSVREASDLADLGKIADLVGKGVGGKDQWTPWSAAASGANVLVKQVEKDLGLTPKAAEAAICEAEAQNLVKKLLWKPDGKKTKPTVKWVPFGYAEAQEIPF